MPKVDTGVIEGVFSQEQKQEMIKTITDTLVAIEGESLREVAWVRVRKVDSGEWGIGERAMTAEEVKAL